jgi:hypothetical protein
MNNLVNKCKCDDALKNEYGYGLCPLHLAAPKMLEALYSLTKWPSVGNRDGLKMAIKAIEAAEKPTREYYA